MSESPSVVSPTLSSPIHYLNPALQAALGSMDVQMEEELARYRRQKAGLPVMPSPSWESTQPPGPIGLIDLDPVASSVAAATTAAKERTSQEQTPQILENAPSSTDTPETYSPTDEYPPTVPLTADSEPDEENSVRSSEAAGWESPQAPATSVGGDLVYQGAIPDPPDDYLASSEQLLRSLDEEEAQIGKKRSIRDNLLTPIGVSLMLLLLLSSAAVGYILLNRSSSSYLGFGRSKNSPTSTVAQSSIQKLQVTSNTAAEPPIPNSPNLASQEFVDLNLNNLSTLKTSPSPSTIPLPPASPKPVARQATPSPIPTPVSNGRPQDLVSALVPLSLAPMLVPSPTAPAAPAPAAKKTPPASATPTQVGANYPKLQKNFYYVMTKYESDRTLPNVRKIAGDAYVLKFPEGRRIQIAAFYKESEAKEFVQELQKKGVYAWVYHP